jgi:hypothetical protein
VGNEGSTWRGMDVFKDHPRLLISFSLGKGSEVAAELFSFILLKLTHTL